MRSNVGIVFVLSAAALSSCVGIPSRKAETAPPVVSAQVGADTAATAEAAEAQAAAAAAGILFVGEDKARDKLVACALELIGQKPDAKVTINGRTFTLDCTGTVSAAYWSAGFDIRKNFTKYEGNGVNRLYKSIRDWDALHELREPKTGDLVFWSNTYDRNGNGKSDDDGLTHVGLVIAVERDGTVHYLHASYTRGVVIAYFNLLHPDEPKSPQGKVWNSPMYLGANYDKTTNPPHWLSGDLWSAFGDAGKTMKAARR